MHPIRTLGNYGLILTFLCILLAPVVCWVARCAPPAIRLDENRSLADLPNLWHTELRNLPGSLEQYLNDHFPFRTQLVALYVKVAEQGLGVPVRRFLCGKKGELYPEFRDAPTIRVWMGLKTLSLEQLQRLRALITGRWQWLANHGIHYLFAIAPDKTTIYPEFLPDWIQQAKGKTPREQLVEVLAATPVPLLDLGPVLLERKGEGRLFDKLFDTTHWSGFALHLSYLALCDRLRTWFPNLQPVSLGDGYELRSIAVTAMPYGSEVVSMIELLPNGAIAIEPSPFSQSLTPEKPIWSTIDRLQKRGGKGTLCFAVDSYFKNTRTLKSVSDAHGSIFPLAHNFQTTIQIYYPIMNYSLLNRLIAEERPDVVVEAHAERALPNGFPEDAELLLLGEKTLGTPILALTPENGALLAETLNCTIFREADALVLQAANNDPQIQLPPVLVGDARRLIIGAFLEAPDETVMQVFYARDDQSYDVKRAVNYPIHPGLNRVYLAITLPSSGVFRLRFDCGMTPGKYRFLNIPTLGLN
jgi:hypothetical protein